MGAVTRRFLDPFGNTLAPNTGGTWPDNNKFLNQPNNTLDLIDMGARLYDPKLGRFLTVDPILTPYQPRQNNGYNYGWNNPLANPDPTGTSPDDGTSSQAAYCMHYGGCDTSTPTTDSPSDPTSPNCVDICLPTEVAEDYAAVPTTTAVETAPTATPGTLDHLSPDDIINQNPAYFRESKDDGGIFEFFYNLTPIPDIIGCVHGDWASCAWAVAGAIPGIGTGAKVGKQVVKGVVGAAEEGVEKGAKELAEKALEACGKHSFRADTPVLMADGSTKPISQVVVGDKVLATDPETGNTTAQVVTAVMAHHDDYLLDLTVTAGESTTSILHTTRGHRIYQATHNFWVEAEALAIGDALSQPTGNATVTGMKLNETPGIMYDLTVDEVHTFYAGGSLVLVHNSDGCGTWGPLTKDGAAATRRGGPAGTTFYKSKADATWWTPDKGGHGGSAFKVYEETLGGLQWIKDAKADGTYIDGKWKGSTAGSRRSRFVDS